MLLSHRKHSHYQSPLDPSSIDSLILVFQRPLSIWSLFLLGGKKKQILCAEHRTDDAHNANVSSDRRKERKNLQALYICGAVAMSSTVSTSIHSRLGAAQYLYSSVFANTPVTRDGSLISTNVILLYLR